MTPKEIPVSDLKLIPGGKPDLLELDLPKSASECFKFLSIRAAERYAANPEDQKWAMISDVFGRLAEFSAPFPHASARHVKWAYQIILRRVPQSAEETGPLVEWMSKIPALATDKAAAAPLLWHYLANCAGRYGSSIPVPQGKPGAWQYERAGLAIPCSNEEAWALGQQRHFWSVYQGRLLFVVGCLLQEMAGVPVEVAVAPPELAPAADPPSDPPSDPPPSDLSN